MFGLFVSFIIFCLSFHRGHTLHTIADADIHALRLFTDITDTDIDVIVLSQEWPVAECLYYKYEMYPGGGCYLPEQKNQWTIHGIWPRNIEGKYLEFCNEKWSLNPRHIKSIESELKKAQIVVRKEDPPYVFWSHEWRKHGTCASVLEPFNTQLKYFSKSIEWNQKYVVADMLEAANIFPDDTKYLDPEVVANAVKVKIGKDPMIGCIILDGVPYLQEVRICMDKKFNVINCEIQVIDDWCYSPKGLIYPASEWLKRP